MSSPRSCPVCGAPLDGMRADAECCGAACRRERLRLRRLSAGVPDPPYATLAEYTQRAQRRAEQTDKMRGRPRASRTDRARQVVMARVAAAPNRRRVAARRLYAGYLQWAHLHEPDRPLSYAAFVRAVDELAPFDDRRFVPSRGRGRPLLVYFGLALVADDDLLQAA